MTHALTLPLPLDAPTDFEAWQIRRSGRARRMSARVHADGRVEIVVPQASSQRVVLDFIARHRDWIVQRVHERERPGPEPFPPQRLELSGFDEVWRLHLAGGSGGVSVRAQADHLLVLSGQGDRMQQRLGLRRWLIRYAHGRFEARLQELARQHGFRFETLQVRRQRTRWGSCSSRGVISLNVAAAFQRAEVLDYLMLHELAHTRIMNHSHGYWRTVAACCPAWRALDRELSQGWKRVPQWLFED